MAVFCVDEHELCVLWLQGIWQQAEKLLKTKFRFYFYFYFLMNVTQEAPRYTLFNEKRAFAEMDTTAINFF